jgi:hypothetical protein
MSKKAFDKIAEGLTEALAIARGGKKPAKLHPPHPEEPAQRASRRVGRPRASRRASSKRSSA